MSQQWFDPSSKWVVEERGASILYLAGARSVVSCRARKAEVVQPRKLPDGLLEARFAGSIKPQLVLVEEATYPEQRVVAQVRDDLRLVRQARSVLVDAVVNLPRRVLFGAEMSLIVMPGTSKPKSYRRGQLPWTART